MPFGGDAIASRCVLVMFGGTISPVVLCTSMADAELIVVPPIFSLPFAEKKDNTDPFDASTCNVLANCPDVALTAKTGAFVELKLNTPATGVVPMFRADNESPYGKKPIDLFAFMN